MRVELKMRVAVSLIIIALLSGCVLAENNAQETPQINSETENPPVIQQAGEKPLLNPDDYDHGETDLYLRDLTIDSLDFLTSFEELNSLAISQCHIAEDVKIPPLKTLTSINISDSEGVDGIDLIAKSLPLPNLISIMYTTEYDLKIENVLPEIPTLTTVNICAYNPIDIIQNNTQLTYITIKTDAGATLSLDGIERFEYLEHLTVRESKVIDLTPLAECKNLRTLNILWSTAVTSLEPLYELENLEIIYLDLNMYRTMLSDEDREHFNSDNNLNPGFVWVYHND